MVKVGSFVSLALSLATVVVRGVNQPIEDLSLSKPFCNLDIQINKSIFREKKSILSWGRRVNCPFFKKWKRKTFMNHLLLYEKKCGLNKN